WIGHRERRREDFSEQPSVCTGVLDRQGLQVFHSPNIVQALQDHLLHGQCRLVLCALRSTWAFGWQVILRFFYSCQIVIVFCLLCLAQALAVPLETSFGVTKNLGLLQQRFHWFCFSNDFVCRAASHRQQPG